MESVRRGRVFLRQHNLLADAAWSFLLGAVFSSVGCTQIAQDDSSPAESSSTNDSNDSSDAKAESKKSTATKADASSAGKSEADSEETGDAEKPGTQKDESPKNPEEKPSGDCVDGTERECAETEDGKAIDFPGGIPRGSCRMGAQLCEEGKWSKCVGAVPPREKDTCEPNNDDNCNGRPTDHCGCVAGTTQECGSDVGVCQKGKITCQENGEWGDDCIGEIAPSEEICDGKADENCDGKSDEENCECINGRTMECGASNTGECRLGTKTCTDGKWGSCVGAVGPRPELCDGRGKDEDCDGRADVDDLDCDCNNGDLKSCEVPGKLGDCRLGALKCQSGKWGFRCQQRFSPQREVCGRFEDPQENKLGRRPGDEDCDGQVDESDASNQFSPGGPSHLAIAYMRDEDGDGWGAMLPPGKPRSYVSRKYCRGREHDVPSGWVRANSNEMRDCGDCPGTGREVNPGYQGDYRETPNACLQEVGWRHGAFDYDCSRTEERKFLQKHVCEEDVLSCESTRRAGWTTDDIPGCGESRGWLEADDCSFSDASNGCVDVLIGRRKTQSCK